VYDVITEGEFVQKGSRLKVLDIRANRIIVSKEGEDDG
jgi:hypothetical protein